MGKRKRIAYQSVADIDVEGLTESADTHLACLSARIKGEVESLQLLERAIDEGESDTDEPEIAAINGENHGTAMCSTMPRPSQQTSGAASPSTDADDHEDRGDDAIPEEDVEKDRRGWKQLGVYVSDVPGDGQLRAQLRRARDRGRKKRKKDFSSFDLGTVNEEVLAFMGDSSRAGGLELPNFSKMQRLQVGVRLWVLFPETLSGGSRSKFCRLSSVLTAALILRDAPVRVPRFVHWRRSMDWKQEHAAALGRRSSRRKGQGP